LTIIRYAHDLLRTTRSRMTGGRDANDAISDNVSAPRKLERRQGWQFADGNR